MDFHDVVRRRRMVRNFDDRPVPADVLERVLVNATHAPSAGFAQGWAFVVLEGREQTETFWRLTTDDAWRARTTRQGLFDAPVIVLPLAHKQAYLERYAEADKAGAGMDVEEGWPMPYWYLDVAFASMLMLLTAVDAGLGALFFGIFRGRGELLDALGVPEGYEPIGAIALGWPAPLDHRSPSLARGRRPVQDVVHRGRW